MCADQREGMTMALAEKIEREFVALALEKALVELGMTKYAISRLLWPDRHPKDGSKTIDNWLGRGMRAENPGRLRIAEALMLAEIIGMSFLELMTLATLRARRQ